MDIADPTGQTTLALLESRLLRVENLLYGATDPGRDGGQTVSEPTVESLAELEYRFTALVNNIRVYSELLKIYRSHPSLFQAPSPDVPPTQLDPDAVRATVLSYASAFPATASALNAAIVDTPIPDAALSAQLVSLVPRMESLEKSQNELDGEVAELRSRSERLVRQYYERRALASAKVVANVETRLERAEGRVRWLEKEEVRKAEMGV